MSDVPGIKAWMVGTRPTMTLDVFGSATHLILRREGEA
jgi:hypothetical protein